MVCSECDSFPGSVTERDPYHCHHAVAQERDLYHRHHAVTQERDPTISRSVTDGAIDDANNGGRNSSDGGDTNTGGNSNCNPDSSRNTARSSRNTHRLEHQIQKLYALQPWLDSASKQADRARREVVTDIFSYF